MQIETAVSLQPYTTFGLVAQARQLVHIRSHEDLEELLQSLWLQDKHYIFGGGSNLVLVGDYDGLVVVMQTQGIRLLSSTPDSVRVEAAAGEDWNHFVHHCTRQGWHGLENLVAIPGTVGAAPVQNIGAYGIEAKDVVETVYAYDLHTGQPQHFTAQECHFDYRHSRFKEEPGRYIVSSVIFRLSTHFTPHLEYTALQRLLQARHILHPEPLQLIDLITELRWSKLPRPETLGSAGSFFKNPVVSATTYARLCEEYPTIVAHPLPDGNYKLAAGWLIEQAGWKGRRIGSVGVHHKQALVLVNYGGAIGRDILNLSQDITADVSHRFGVQLQPEAIFVQ